MYGATEAAPRLSYLEPERLDDKLGSIGKPVDNVDLLLVDEKGNTLPPGQEGEIAARGSNIMQGYWKDPEGTAEVLRNGLYYTGDLAKIDDEGFFFIVGRSKDIIKVKGFRVSAKEIEEKILELDEVHETAVIAVEDDILGEAIKAYIVPRSEGDNNRDTIEQYLRKSLPPYKLPKYIEFRKELPKNKSGKILKQKLKEELNKDE
jgi:acyl-CoA synthetase (AMP-forming)/AMP-acid ligase II